MKNQFWAIKTNNGYFCQWTLSYTRREAINKFENETCAYKPDWKEYRIKRGYRCVKVKIIVVKN